MRILIDIGHPAHVHLFKHFALQMQEKGHEIFFTVRDKEFEVYLLNVYGFKYKSFGKHFKSKTGKILGLFLFDLQMLRTVLSFKPDIYLSHGSIYAAHIAWLLRKPHIALEDTGNMEQVNLYLPFSSVVLTSNVFHKYLGMKQIQYNGYHELAYLHPTRFKRERNIREIIGVDKIEKIFMVRFVSWKASHDIEQEGLTLENKRAIIAFLKKFGKVLISSEKALDSEFERYKITLPPERIHDVLGEADLFIGEGATMASESAMLGTPAIYINFLDAGTIDDQERHGLLFHFRNFEGVLDKAVELLNDPDSKEKNMRKRDELVKDKIDVTDFLVWFVENYPLSFQIMKENPEYQERFRLR